MQQASSIGYHAPVFHHTFPDGTRLAYLDTGLVHPHQPVLLFLHGLATYAPSWQENVNALKMAARCISIDLPGFGLSDPSRKGYGLATVAVQLIDFIKRQQLRKLVLIGHSLGGQIALHVALKYPQFLEKLVLISPAGFESFSIWDKQIILNGTQMLHWLSSPENYLRQMIHACFYNYHKQGEKMMDDLVALLKRYAPQEYNNIVRGYIHAMLQEPVRSRLSEISMPVLSIFGAYDALIPNRVIHGGSTRQVALEANQLLQQGQLHVLKNAGHYVHREKANEVNELIKKFIAIPAPK